MSVPGDAEGKLQWCRITSERNWASYFPLQKYHYWDKQAQQEGAHHELTRSDIWVTREVEVMCLRNEQSWRADVCEPPSWYEQTEFCSRVFSLLDAREIEAAAARRARAGREEREEREERERRASRADSPRSLASYGYTQWGVDTDAASSRS